MIDNNYAQVHIVHETSCNKCVVHCHVALVYIPFIIMYIHKYIHNELYNSTVLKGTGT